MKRSAYIIVLFSFLLGGCTLVMDDFDPEEKDNLEEVGFDEPYTLQTEYGDITYQYGDNTEVLREEALDYLVKVEHDTVLYFSDNIPRRLLVREGKYVSMGCKEQLPHGLCSEVVSLTHENGMYRMQTERKLQGEVFKMLDIDINVDYDQQMSFDPDSDYLEAQGVHLTETDTNIVFTDWALFGDEMVRRKQTEIRQRVQALKETRANDDDEEGETGDSKYSPKDEDIDVIKSKDRSTRILTINNKKLSKWKGPFGKLPDMGIQTSLVISYHEQTNIRHIQKVSNGQDYVLDKYDETPKLNFKANIGWSKTALNGEKKLQGAYDKLFSGFNAKDFNEKHNISVKDFMLHIPLPIPIPVELFLRVAPTGEVKFSLLGEIEFEKGLGAIHKEVECNKGKIVKSDFKINDKVNKDFTWKTFDVYGLLTISAGVEVLAGAAVTGGLFGLGIGAELGAELTFKKTASLGYADPYNAYTSLEVFLEPIIKAFAKTPAGNEWEFKESIPGLEEHYSIFGPKVLSYFPTIGSPKGSFTIAAEGNTVAKVSASYKFSDMNLLTTFAPNDYKAGAALYRVTEGEETLVKKESVGDALNTKNTYSFYFEDFGYKAGSHYKVVPCLIDKDTQSDVLFKEGDVVYKNNQISCGKDMKENLFYVNHFVNNYEVIESGGQEREKWKFVVQAHIPNTSRMVEWKEWGVEMSIDRYEFGTNNFIKRMQDKKRYPVREIVYENNVSLKFQLTSNLESYDYEVESYLYYITHDDKIHYVKPDDVNILGIRLTREMDDNWDGYIGNGDQVVNVSTKE